MPDSAAKPRSSLIRKIILFVAMSASTVSVFQCSPIETAEDKLLTDLKLISDGKSPAGYLNSFDLICFTLNTEIPTYELLVGSKLKHQNFSPECRTSLLSKIIGRSPVVGLVRDNYIECVEITKFDYLIGSELRCVQPDKLQVEKITSAPRFKHFLRPGPDSRPPPAFHLPTFLFSEKQ
jgi:hypothetical protein